MMGLEWNMTKSEVRNILAEQENCSIVDTTSSNTLAYSINDFQGIEGANAFLFMSFSEGKLVGGSYVFSSDEGGKIDATSSEMIEELKKAFRKSYKDSSEAACELPGGDGIFNISVFYKGSDSFIHIYGWLPTSLTISFENVDSWYSQNLLKELDMDE